MTVAGIGNDLGLLLASGGIHTANLDSREVG